eukprot:Skav232481  [mRNA]  locus=scaffold2877:257564:260359:+ [translate_table: standard]
MDAGALVRWAGGELFAQAATKPLAVIFLLVLVWLLALRSDSSTSSKKENRLTIKTLPLQVLWIGWECLLMCTWKVAACREAAL